MTTADLLDSTREDIFHLTDDAVDQARRELMYLRIRDSASDDTLVCEPAKDHSP
jgi:hypothetical protein